MPGGTEGDARHGPGQQVGVRSGEVGAFGAEGVGDACRDRLNGRPHLGPAFGSEVAGFLVEEDRAEVVVEAVAEQGQTVRGRVLGVDVVEGGRDRRGGIEIACARRSCLFGKWRYSAPAVIPTAEAMSSMFTPW